MSKTKNKQKKVTPITESIKWVLTENAKQFTFVLMLPKCLLQRPWRTTDDFNITPKWKWFWDVFCVLSGPEKKSLHYLAFALRVIRLRQHRHLRNLSSRCPSPNVLLQYIKRATHSDDGWPQRWQHLGQMVLRIDLVQENKCITTWAGLFWNKPVFVVLNQSTEHSLQSLQLPWFKKKKKQVFMTLNWYFMIKKEVSKISGLLLWGITERKLDDKFQSWLSRKL